MGFLLSLAGFLIAITILVFIHEYGHYKVALLCGVKVKRFSIGFGKPIFKRTDKNGVEWVVGWAPLGGYVMMLDGRNEAIPPGEEHLAFDRMPLAKRFAIVAAGPLANLLFAFCAWAIVFSMETQVPKAYLGTPTIETIAAKSGFKAEDLLVSLNKQPVQSMEDVALLFAEAALSGDKSLVAEVQRDGKVESIHMDLSSLDMKSAGSDLLGALGWSSPGPQRAPKTFAVIAHGPAAKAGLVPGDIIKSVNGEAVYSNSDLSARVSVSDKIPLKLEVEGKDKAIRQLTVVPELKPNSPRAKIGVAFDTTLTDAEKSKYMTNHQRSFTQALKASIERCYAVSKMSLQAIGSMITGRTGSEGLSGPIGIAQEAGGAVSSGFVPFMSFLALLSLSLFLMNLLPLPALDGGHLVLFTIEGIMRKPLSDQTQQTISKIGFGMLLFMMGFALYSDLSKFTP